jgi:hypothetical protein
MDKRMCGMFLYFFFQPVPFVIFQKTFYYVSSYTFNEISYIGILKKNTEMKSKHQSYFNHQLQIFKYDMEVFFIVKSQVFYLVNYQL